MDTTISYKVTVIKTNATGKEEATIYDFDDYHQAIGCFNNHRKAGYKVQFDDIPRALPRVA